MIVTTDEVQCIRDFSCPFLKGHCLLEMPSGTGKTMSLLALIVAYINSKSYPDLVHPDMGLSNAVPVLGPPRRNLTASKNRSLYVFP